MTALNSRSTTPVLRQGLGTTSMPGELSWNGDPPGSEPFPYMHRAVSFAVERDASYNPVKLVPLEDDIDDTW